MTKDASFMENFISAECVREMTRLRQLCVFFDACLLIRGIRSLDETRRLDQSETVKVARAVKQKYKKLGLPPPRPRNPCCPLPYFIKK